MSLQETVIKELKKENRELLQIISDLRKSSNNSIILEENHGIIPKYSTGDIVQYFENGSYGYEVEVLQIKGLSGKTPLYSVINNRNGHIVNYVEETKLVKK